LQVAKATKGIFTNWTQVKQPEHMTVGDIRRFLCSDEKFATLTSDFEELGINFTEFEAKPLRTHIAIQHTDLHGMNILLSKEN
ncbi:hypothetical protein HKB21_07005, partial [Vibrio parahaemolyticus]|nr:hypothetical protein [Vibrio parahaemolyticus]